MGVTFTANEYRFPCFSCTRIIPLHYYQRFLAYAYCFSL